MPARPAHRRRKPIAQKVGEPLRQAGSRSVDHEKRPQREVLEIEKQIAVERDAARDRKRRQGRAVEHRQALQLLRRERGYAALLDQADKPVELAPASLSTAAKFAALQHQLG